ncbi:Satratoxin biosynthesis SC1 cluster protein 4 [Colletotrichum sidae]|uniref:Satratoxin biosynthesis SC1 cluster protein 4 n=3 Tax=Colletotrichum orbiculare species complex TaxID=2707354 RepID=N4VIZ2_COLOR|nr:Satratoxin biosynthesis SC1 cluster protein 4 [Colletotrichum orbiculare MAFF 240422]TDZ71782.1 Satratoxin biosynthesis SC1 cluster protein 4 [Colletotrichum trifolii]TDZ87621.1 Satratoxin biosynthesis SC1 cluster protein 4 [Colletotrichum sidae]
MATVSVDDPLADRGPELSGTTTALLVLATVFVGLRFWARWTVGFNYGLDDWAMVVGLIFTFVAGGLNYAMIAQGLGRHASTLSTAQQVEFLKLLLAFECIYVTAVMFIKISLLLMYRRIFPSRGFKISAMVLGGVTIAWWISIVLVCVFQCTPVAKAYMPWIDGTCIDLKGSFIGNAIPNILTDVAILCLPIGQVWRLQATLVQRLSLCFMFLLGGFVLFASIYRFTTIMQFQLTDTTWTLATACTWCVVECACGVISACLPTLRPLMVKVSSQFGSIATKYNLSGGQSGGRATKQGSRNPTELITIGGTGGKSADRGFKRLGTEDGKYGITTSVTRGSEHSVGKAQVDSDSGDDLSLKGGIRIKVDQEVCWGEENSKYPTSSKYQASSRSALSGPDLRV